MRGASLRQARWQPHVNGVNPPAALRHWLTGAASLTAKLKARSDAFRVQRLHQRSARCLLDEAAALGLSRAERVWEREVLLRCDGEAVVFAHTVVPLAASASDWPLFGALGERSLGSTLFGDRQVRRGALEYARLRSGHPLMRRARAALGVGEHAVLYARRCLYRRHRGVLLVTEVFLPALLDLAEPGPLPLEPGSFPLEPGSFPIEPGSFAIEPGPLLLEPGSVSIEPGPLLAEPRSPSTPAPAPIPAARPRSNHSNL